MRDIWKVAVNFESETFELEERIRVQMMYTEVMLKEADDIFESYLLKSTCFDSPDRGYNSSLSIAVGKAVLENRAPTLEEVIAASQTKSGSPKKKKGDWGYVYQKGDEYQIALNFQVRFK